MNLIKKERDLLLGLLDTARVDAICGDNNLDQDELGYLMAKLGDESMQSICEVEMNSVFLKTKDMKKFYESEVKRLRGAIEQNPADVKLLKQEYKQLTGKQYRRRKD